MKRRHYLRTIKYKFQGETRERFDYLEMSKREMLRDGLDLFFNYGIRASYKEIKDEERKTYKDERQ